MRKRRLLIAVVMPFLALWQVSLAAAEQAAQGRAAGCSAAQSDNPAVQLRGRSAAATKLAYERYHMLRYIEARHPGFGLGTFFVNNNEILFPLGRSDRAYALELGGEDTNWVSCYQRTVKAIGLVYRIKVEWNYLRLPHVSAKPALRIASLLDYITRGGRENGYALTGRVSKFALSDLSIKREYVVYGFNVIEVALHVTRLIADQSERYGIRFDSGEWYPLDDKLSERIFMGSTSPSPASNQDFDRKYGLPVAEAELPLLR